MEIEKVNKKVTGNWYIRNGVMYIEVKRKTRDSKYSIPLATFKYISEDRIDYG